MAYSPVGVVVFSVSSRLLIASVTASAVELGVYQFDPCDDWSDVFTGCDGTANAILGSALGAVPGAPAQFNAILVVVQNTMLLWAVATFFRGN